MTIDIIEINIIQGLLLFFFTFGLFLSFRIAKFQDLSGEGAFTWGAALTGVMLIKQIPAVWILPLVFVLGGLIGVITVLASFKLGIHSLIAGVIMNTMLYSINLRIMSSPNLPLFNQKVLFPFEHGQLGWTIIFLGVVVLITLFSFYIFFNTEKGLTWRAVGLNPHFARHHGLSKLTYTALPLFFSHGLIAFSGSCLAQIQGYVDLNMGIGLIIHGLASLMIGEFLIQNGRLLSALMGALIYQQIQGIVLSIGSIQPTDIKLVTGMILLMIFFLKNLYIKGEKIRTS